MRLIAAPLLALLAASGATAQPAQPAQAAAAYSERMTPLSGLVGEWRGTAWMLSPSGTRETYSSHESVSRRLSGNALLVEGRHHAADGRVVHDAMAMITWDQRAGGYRMRSALANGMGGDFPLEVTPGGFIWRIDMPGGRIEYVIELSGDTWTERGRRTGADGRSIEFFGMTLQRAR